MKLWMFKKLTRVQKLEENIMSAVTDLTAVVAELKVSVDAAVAKLGQDNPAVVQAVTDLQAMKAELDAAVASA